MKPIIIILSTFAIVLFMMSSYDEKANAQTSIEVKTIYDFLSLPENKICSYDLSTGERKDCNSPIAYIVNNTTNTLYIETNNLHFMGPVLDLIYDKGFKLVSSFDGKDVLGEPSTFMYFRK